MFKSIGNSFGILYRKSVAAATALVVFFGAVAAGGGTVRAQTIYDFHESERSDKLTGGRIAVGGFEPGQPNILLTLNVPSFRLTLWQDSREVKSYFVGVGLKDYPMKKMLSKVTRRTQFEVETSSIEQGRALEDGRVLPLIPTARKKKR